MGNWIEDSVQLQALVRNFYYNLYTLDRASELNRARSGLLTRLNDTHNLILNEDFSRDEVIAALKSMVPFKAPGIDGFQAGFF